MIDMLENEFTGPVSVDAAPVGSHCEWCSKPAIYNLLVTGGKHHNEEGLFCADCGEKFVRVVTGTLDKVLFVKTNTQLESL